jgi:hypothetical protein
MDSVLVLGKEGDENKDEREGWEMSYLGAHGEPLSKNEKDVLFRDMSPISPSVFQNVNGGTNGDTNGTGRGEFKVKDLSRLWLYVNGKSPKMDEVDAGIERMST